MYYLYSLRYNGWWSGYNYTSDLDQATQFLYEDALEMAAKHKDNRGLSMVPISRDDIEKIKELSNAN